MVLPYLKGLVIIKCGFFYLSIVYSVWIYCVFSICGDYICRSIQVLNTSPRGGYESLTSIFKWIKYIKHKNN
jgi:hypothetical protein